MARMFVGDIHGCCEEFKKLLEELGFYLGKDELFLTGDAFTRGPDPRGVWDMIKKTRARMVLGNQDYELLKQMLELMGGGTPDFEKPYHRAVFNAMRPVFDELCPWLNALPLCINDPDFLLVHAGINPEQGLNGTFREDFLDIRAWPPSNEKDAPRWHDWDGIVLPGNLPIIFGHDAQQGLVIKFDDEGNPIFIGLDTSCVYKGRYGGDDKLSAWNLEEKKLAQVDYIKN